MGCTHCYEYSRLRLVVLLRVSVLRLSFAMRKRTCRLNIVKQTPVNGQKDYFIENNLSHTGKS